MKTGLSENIICRLVCYDEGWEKSVYMNPPKPGDTINLSGKEYKVLSVTDDGCIDSFGEYDYSVAMPTQCYNVILKSM